MSAIPARIPVTDQDADYITTIAERLSKGCDADGYVGETLQDIRNAAGALDWIAANVELPFRHRGDFRGLLDRSHWLQKLIETEEEAA